MMECDICGSEYPATPGYMKIYCDFTCEGCLLMKKLHPDIFWWVVQVAKQQAKRWSERRSNE